MGAVTPHIAFASLDQPSDSLFLSYAQFLRDNGCDVTLYNSSVAHELPNEMGKITVKPLNPHRFDLADRRNQMALAHQLVEEISLFATHLITDSSHYLMMHIHERMGRKNQGIFQVAHFVKEQIDQESPELTVAAKIMNRVSSILFCHATLASVEVLRQIEHLHNLRIGPEEEDIHLEGKGIFGLLQSQETDGSGDSTNNWENRLIYFFREAQTVWSQENARMWGMGKRLAQAATITTVACVAGSLLFAAGPGMVAQLLLPSQLPEVILAGGARAEALRTKLSSMGTLALVFIDRKDSLQIEADLMPIELCSTKISLESRQRTLGEIVLILCEIARDTRVFVEYLPPLLKIHASSF